MPKRILAALLAVCLLCACAPAPAAGTDAARPVRAVDLWPGADDDFDNWFGVWPDTGPAAGSEQVPARTAAQRAYGSAGLVGWPSILVSVYLDEWNGAGWDEAAIAASRQKLGIAVQWIQDQCAAYGAAPRIYYDDGTPDSGLFYHQTYNGRFAGGEESDEPDAYYDTVEALCAELDTDALHARYGTSSVGFLFFLPVAGVSFTMVHYLEDEDYYYHEYCSLYRYDAYSGPGAEECPAVYAHEILHLFGAADLYEDSSDLFMTPELTRYVEDTWPDAVMLDTYAPDGSLRQGAVDKTLCPLTAYRLGLIPRPGTLAGWPDLDATPPGTFTENAASAARYPYDSGAVAA